MAKMEILAPFILSWEGGFVDHPNDRGGATNMGVTLETYEYYCRKKGYPRPTVERLQALTKEKVIDILKTMYWDRAKADYINNQSIANLIVDWVWASGTWGIKFTQRVLGLTEDGIVGPQTLGAINSAEPKALFAQLWKSREAHFKRLAANNPSQQVFLRGWLNRLNGIRYGSLAHNGNKIVNWDE
ncbi:MAG: glycosyl hydrolase 108 family protein [Rikenellaceae bacterium]